MPKPLLERFLATLRSEIRTARLLRAPPQDIATKEQAADALEGFLADTHSKDRRTAARALAKAFGVSPPERDNHEENARVIYPLWREGLSTPQILDRLSEEGIDLGCDQRTVQRIINEWMPALAAEEIDRDKK